jgi:hypothetical protein
MTKTYDPNTCAECGVRLSDDERDAGRYCSDTCAEISADRDAEWANEHNDEIYRAPRTFCEIDIMDEWREAGWLR